MGENNSKPHIALFISSMRKGGAERVMGNLAEYLFGQGWKVTLVTTYFNPPEYILPDGDWDPETGKNVSLSGKGEAVSVGQEKSLEGRNPGRSQSGELPEQSGAAGRRIHRIYSEPLPEQLTGNRIRNFRCRFDTIQKIWKEEKPDLILSFIGMTNIMAILTAEKLQIPVIVSVRSTRALEYNSCKLRFLADHVYPKAAGVIFQTGQVAASFPPAVRRKAKILPNSVNPAFMQPRYQGQREQCIVSVGTLDENKNQAMLLRAFAAVHQDFPAVQLRLYGDGPARQSLIRLSEDLSLQVADLSGEVSSPAEERNRSGSAEAEDNDSAPAPSNREHRIWSTGGGTPVTAEEADVVFEGARDDIPEQIRKALIYVLCSNIEGMPNSLIEAMSLGLACISTDCSGGGPASLIESGLNGYLVPVGDTKALEAKLRYLLMNPKEIDRVGQQAARVQEDYNPERINQQWEDYLLSQVPVRE